MSTVMSRDDNKKAAEKEEKVTVYSTFKLGKQGEETVLNKQKETVVTDGTSVRCGTGVTISKNFQSVKLECFVEYPTFKDKVKVAAEKAWDIVSEELAAQMAEAQKLLKKLGA